jgi:hypothetical protein
MIFGQTSQVAIEAEALRTTGKWLYGHLRFWVGGQALGDFEDSSDLAGSARWGRRFLASSARRTRSDLDGEDVAIVYYKLFGRFFERGATGSEETFDRDPYVLDDVGESSLRDRISVLTVRRSDGRDRIVVHDHRASRTWEVLAPSGTCDEVVATYCSWVEAQQMT